MLPECDNNILFYLHVYLILLMLVPIMPHDINKKKSFNIFKKNKIIKEIVENKDSFIHSPPRHSFIPPIPPIHSFSINKTRSFPANNKWCTNTIKSLGLHNLETKYHLKIKLFTEANSYETFF